MKFPMPHVQMGTREVEEATVEMVERVYREQYQAVHPMHEEPTQTDEEILDFLAALGVTGGPQTSDVARFVAKHGGEFPEAPVVTSLNPATVVIGAPSFDIHVIGTGFKDSDVIVFNGFDEPTTFVSATELTTGVNMPLWTAPASVPVSVKNGIGQESNAEMFDFTV